MAIVALAGTAQAAGTGAAKPTMAPGWGFKATRNIDVNLPITVNGQQAMTIVVKNHVEFLEEIVKVSEAQAAEVTRKIVKAEAQETDTDTGKLVSKTLAKPGDVYRVAFAGGSSDVTDAKTGAAVGEDLSEALGGRLTPELWPKGELQQGMKWSYKGAEVTRRLAFMSASGGRLDLQVDLLNRNERTGLMMAYITGTLVTKLKMDPAAMDLRATVEIHLPVDIAVPLKFAFKGTLTGKFKAPNDQGEMMEFTVDGQGSYEQRAMPSMKVVQAVRK